MTRYDHKRCRDRVQKKEKDLRSGLTIIVGKDT